jgi:hypothetical protein
LRRFGHCKLLLSPTGRNLRLSLESVESSLRQELHEQSQDFAGMGHVDTHDVDTHDAARRRAIRQELRGVSLLLRSSGYLLAGIGAVGIAIGGSGRWWMTPSWVTLGTGMGLVMAGIVQRVRQGHSVPGLPKG